tara:strand:- start:255 stop:749 length:495 start_codon:yes stop_codon:yes gene_type:complete
MSQNATITDSLIVPECIYRPGTFTGLMTLYESNYVKLLQLIEGFQTFVEKAPEITISQTDLDCDLQLEIKLKEKYTTTLNITYLLYLDDDVGVNAAVLDPDLTIRVYHDAKLIEVLHGLEEHRHQKLCEFHKTHSCELDTRWKNNMMLNKWLDYLLEVGHGFSI